MTDGGHRPPDEPRQQHGGVAREIRQAPVGKPVRPGSDPRVFPDAYCACLFAQGDAFLRETLLFAFINHYDLLRRVAQGGRTVQADRVAAAGTSLAEVRISRVVVDMDRHSDIDSDIEPPAGRCRYHLLQIDAEKDRAVPRRGAIQNNGPLKHLRHGDVGESQYRSRRVRCTIHPRLES